MAGELKPWGRFKLVSKDPADESDHIYLYQSVTRIGRNPQRAHAVIDMPFISSVHCVVRLEGANEAGEPMIRLHDKSRNGVYVNEVRIEKEQPTVMLRSNLTIHFAKPGQAGVPSIAYRFEILPDGLTPENARLRAERDLAVARPPKAAMAGAATPTPTKGQSSGVVATTQLLTGKRHRRSEDAVMLEEMEIEMTRTISSGASDASPSAKRRRIADISADEGSDTELSTAKRLFESNQELRHAKAQLQQERGALKVEVSQLKQEVDSLKDELQISEESKTLVENEAKLKGERLEAREQELEAANEAAAALAAQMDQLRAELVSAKSTEATQAKMVSQLRAQQENAEMEMETMISRLNKLQNDLRTSQDEYKKLAARNQTLELAVDSVQTRTTQVEDTKSAASEELIMLKAERKKIFRDVQVVVTTLARTMLLNREDTSIMSQELEALAKVDISGETYSSEQSQPAPTQESYIGDTQPDVGDSFAETQEQDAAAAGSGLVERTQLALPADPFTSDHSRIELHQNISLDIDQQQPISADLSALDDTPPEKSSLEESGQSSRSTSSKTPPAPPLPRAKLTAPPVAVQERKHDEANETNRSEEEESEDEKDGKDEEEDEKDDEEVDAEEEGEMALPDDEEDKENTLMKPADETASAKPKPQGWLQMIVNKEEEKSEQASEGGGLFDDETQLSGGE